MSEDPFVRPEGWKITWTPPADKSILQSAFAPNGTLLIGIGTEEPGQTRTYELAWLDESCRVRTLTGLLSSTSAQDVSQLVGPGRVSVDGMTSDWDVTLTLDQARTGFIGKLTKGFGEDPNVGTLTAVANPSGETWPAPQKFPRWLRWLRRLLHRLDEPRPARRVAA